MACFDYCLIGMPGCAVVLSFSFFRTNIRSVRFDYDVLAKFINSGKHKYHTHKSIFNLLRSFQRDLKHTVMYLYGFSMVVMKLKVVLRTAFNKRILHGQLFVSFSAYS